MLETQGEQNFNAKLGSKKLTMGAWLPVFLPNKIFLKHYYGLHN